MQACWAQVHKLTVEGRGGDGSLGPECSLRAANGRGRKRSSSSASTPRRAVTATGGRLRSTDFIHHLLGYYLALALLTKHFNSAVRLLILYKLRGFLLLGCVD